MIQMLFYQQHVKFIIYGRDFMKKIVLMIGAVAMSLIAVSCASVDKCRTAKTDGKTMVITENGKACATIVVAADAPYKNQLAAKELKYFLDRISGADFVIKTDDQKVTGPKILVGPSRYTAKMKLDIPSGESYDEIKEGFLIKTVGKDLVLAGNDDGWTLANRSGRKSRKKFPDPQRPYNLAFGKAYKGTLFAVYAFLEKLGCRWYMPGKAGEVVPRNADISIGELDEFERPGFLMRGYWLTPDKNAANDLDAFFHRNRFLEFQAGFSNATDGSIHRFITNDMFKDHPEYFGLLPDGKGRDINVICMSNPDVEEILVKKIRDLFRKNPDVTFSGFAPKDGMFICYCKKCLALNGQIRKQDGVVGAPGKPSISGSYYRLISNVAARLEKEFPDRIISASIYCGRIYTPPSEFKFADNVGGHLALLEYSLVKPIDHPDNWQSMQIAAMFKAWKRRLDNFIYRPYYPNFMFNLTLPIPQMHNIIRDVKFLARPENKPLGMRWECRQVWNLHFLNIYMLGRMLWNPDCDGEKILDEAYNKLYGPAAEPVKKFYSALENAVRNFTVNTHEEELIPEFYNYEFISGLMPLIDEAEKLTSGTKDENLALRMKLLRITADHLYTYSKMRGVCERNRDYAGAAKLAQKMQKLEAQMMKLNPSSFKPSDYKMDKRPVYGKFGANRSSYGKMMQYLNTDALRNGKEGTLAVDFPKFWKFRTDELSQGVVDEWFRKDLDISSWKDIEVPRAIEMQGYFTSKKHMIPYLGEMFYATDFEFDGKFDADKLGLYVGGINNEAWIWINGTMVAYQPSHAWWARYNYTWTQDLPKGVVKPGKNRIVVRVLATDNGGFGGIFRHIFLYQKK